MNEVSGSISSSEHFYDASIMLSTVDSQTAPQISEIKLFSIEGASIMGIELQYKSEATISRVGDISPHFSTATLTLDDDEYITTIEGRKDLQIDYLKMTTNKGNSVEAGGPGGQSFRTFSGIQLIGIDQHISQFLDGMDVYYLMTEGK